MASRTRDHAAHDEIRIAGAEQAVRSKRIEERAFGDAEASLDDRFFGVGPDLIHHSAPADEQTDRLDQDRLTRPGFTRQDLKSGCEVEAHLPDQREV